MATLSDARQTIIYTYDTLASVGGRSMKFYVKRTESGYVLENFRGDDWVTVEFFRVDDKGYPSITEWLAWAWDNEKACIAVDEVGKTKHIFNEMSMDYNSTVEAILYLHLLESPASIFYRREGKFYVPDVPPKLLITDGNVKFGYLIMDLKEFLEWTEKYHGFSVPQEFIVHTVKNGKCLVSCRSGASTRYALLPCRKILILNLDHIENWKNLIKDAKIVEDKYLYRFIENWTDFHGFSYNVQPKYKDILMKTKYISDLIS